MLFAGTGKRFGLLVKIPIQNISEVTFNGNIVGIVIVDNGKKSELALKMKRGHEFTEVIKSLKEN